MSSEPLSTDTLTPSNNGANIPDRGSLVFAVTTATLVLATIFVIGRMVCRGFIVKRVSRDDWLMVAAWVFAFGLSLTINIGAKNGLGRHDENIAAEHWSTLRRCEYAFTVLYNPALMATKSSILVFYLRLSKNTQRVLRTVSWFTLIIVNVAGIVLTLINVFQCRPIAAAWSASADFRNAQCIPILTEFICAAPVNIVTDLTILALPIPVLTGMRLPSKQKSILVLTFTLGIFVTVVDVVRIYYLQQAVSATPIVGLSSDRNALFGGPAQFSWNASLSFMWSAVEVNVGMACACIPTLKPLILKIVPTLLMDPNATRNSSTSSDGDFPHSPIARIRGAVTFAGPLSSQVGYRLPPNHGPVTAHEFLSAAPPPLATPDSESHNSRRYAEDRSLTAAALPPAASLSQRPNRDSREDAIYFGFVNLHRPKSMLKTSAMESFKYCLTVTVLFLLWGMSYGLLNILNNVVASTYHMSRAETLGLTAIYFGGGYLLGPLLVGEWILRRDEHYRIPRSKGAGVDSVGGFKATFIVGLCIYGVGTIIFWPSVVTNSYGGFMLSNFVVGFGVSILETGGNAFIVLCGPSEYGETRALLAQGVQSVGAVVSELMARKAFFRDIGGNSASESARLINVQWTYLAITLVCVGLALFFYYMPLPETTDSELEEASFHRNVNPHRPSFFGLQLRTWSLTLAVFAQYTYNAAQETCGIYLESLLLSVVPGLPSSGVDALLVASDELDRPAALSLATTDFLIIAHAAFAVSRFLTGYFTFLAATRPRMPQPRTILTVSATMSVCCMLTTVLFPRGDDPNMIAIPLTLFFFSQGPIWPLIYGIGLRGQGRRTKRAAAFITMGGSGPAATPFIMYGIITSGGTIQMAYWVVFGFSVLVLVYPVFLDSVKEARLLVDPRITAQFRDADVRIQAGTNAVVDTDKSSSGSGSGSASGSGDDAVDGVAAPQAISFGEFAVRDERRISDRVGRRIARAATTMGTTLGVMRARTMA